MGEAVWDALELSGRLISHHPAVIDMNGIVAKFGKPPGGL